MKNCKGTNKTKREARTQTDDTNKAKASFMYHPRELYVVAAFFVVQLNSFTIVHYASSCDSNLHMNRAIQTRLIE